MCCQAGPCRSKAKVVKVRTIDFIKRIIVLVPTTIPQNPHRLLELRYGPVLDFKGGPIVRMYGREVAAPEDGSVKRSNVSTHTRSHAG